MKKPIIAIDIDEVLADFSASWVEFSNKRWGTSLTVNDYDEDWMSVWGVDIDELKRRSDIHLKERLIAELNHDESALPVLDYLSKSYELIVVTSRPSRMRDDTVAWLASHYPMLKDDKIHFAGFWDSIDEHTIHRTKGDLVKGLGVKYLIDDQPKHCFAAAEHDINALLFGDYSWNQREQLPTNVTRVSNWTHVGEYFANEAGH